MSGTQNNVGPRAATASPVDEDPNAAAVCSSPPCFMHELDPAYLGYLGREEVSSLLGGLLAADWGGAVPEGERLRAALRRHLEASGGGAAAPEPARRTPDRLTQTIRDALPRIHDEALRRDLGETLGALERAGGAQRGGAAPGGR